MDVLTIFFGEIYIYIYNILRNCEFFDDAGLRILGQDHKGAPLMLGNMERWSPSSCGKNNFEPHPF